MSKLDDAKRQWIGIRDEEVKNANTAERVGDAGIAIVDAVIEEIKNAEFGTVEGVVRNVLGESTTDAVSQNLVTEELSKADSKMLQIEGNVNQAAILPYSSVLTKIETTYTPGFLLLVNGSIATSQTNYSTSDYIEVSSLSNIVLAYNMAASSGSGIYANWVFYDENHNFISGRPANSIIANKFLILTIPVRAKYVRYTSSNADLGNNLGLFSGTLSDLIGEIKELESNVIINERIVAIGSRKFVELQNILLNIRVDTSNGQLIPAQGYACVFYDLNPDKIYHVNCVANQYVPGVVYFNKLGTIVGSQFHVQTQGGTPFSGRLNRPGAATQILIQCRIPTSQNITIEQALKLMQLFTIEEYDDVAGISLFNTINIEHGTQEELIDIPLKIEEGWYRTTGAIDKFDGLQYSIITDFDRNRPYFVSLRGFNQHTMLVLYFSGSTYLGGEMSTTQTTMKEYLNLRLTIPTKTTSIVLLSYNRESLPYLFEFKTVDYMNIPTIAKVLELVDVGNSAFAQDIRNTVDSVNTRFQNFIDTENLIGEYHFNQRLSIGQVLINANGFSCIVAEIPENHNGIINVMCSASQYVPGVVFFSRVNDYTSSSQIKMVFISQSQTQTYYKEQVEIPQGAKALVVQVKHDVALTENRIREILGLSFTSDKFVSKNILDESLQKVRQKVFWSDKNIWWCGTSIPAAGFWTVNNPNSYPYIVGQILQTKKVYNEAVGSSQANGSMNAATYEVISRRMGHTIAQKLQICDDLWKIDDVAQTITPGPRVLGITSLPNVATYSDAIYQRYLLLSNGYEIKLIAKYLLSNQEEHDNFLKEKLGARYDAIVAASPTAYTYQDEINLFVIDHSNNDSTAGSYTDINSTDILTYVGALNIYVRLILKYKPHTRIVFVSNYVDSPSGVINTMKAIADNWNMPFLNLLNFLPFNTKFKILTRGYWDENSIWHDDGFEWADDGTDYTTNLYLSGMSSRVKGDLSLAQVIANINPHKIGEIWYWEGYQRDIRIRDGLHPHTDKTFRTLNLYAQTIAGFLHQVGN